MHATCYLNKVCSVTAVNNKDSSVLENKKKGMSFFEQWCANHKNTGNLLPEYNV